MKTRALILKFKFDPDEKKLLTKYFREGGHGLRQGLKNYAINALFAAHDWEAEKERSKRHADLARRND